MIYLSWEEVHALSRACKTSVAATGFVPDYIIGITMGGVVPAALVAEEFKSRNFITISAESYHDKSQGELRITYLPKIDLQDKKILVVDEIADSGATLQKIVEILKTEYKPAALMTATLVVNTDNCRFRPDVWAKEVTDWVHFPWEPA